MGLHVPSDFSEGLKALCGVSRVVLGMKGDLRKKQVQEISADITSYHPDSASVILLYCKPRILLKGISKCLHWRSVWAWHGNPERIDYLSIRGATSLIYDRSGTLIILQIFYDSGCKFRCSNLCWLIVNLQVRSGRSATKDNGQDREESCEFTHMRVSIQQLPIASSN